MSWPLSHEFNEAVQTPRLVFADPDLKGGETVVGATGLPLPRSGNFADVYQVRGADGREWAVKCFTRPVVGLAERYAHISTSLAQANLPFTVGFTFLTEGIRVGGAWYPVVKMEWVAGLLLNQMVRENAGSAKVLTALVQMWSKLCKRLREANVAHADVQHGNVLLVPGSRPGAYGLKLIDYDGMWVKALANTPSGESGHPAYQHPARSGGKGYSPDADRFPHLAIATALRGLLAGGTALWEKYDNGDNVLFTEGDFKRPSESAVMRELWRTDDPAVQALVGRLAIACGKPIPQTPWLDQLAPDGDPEPLDDATRREAAAALGLAAPVPVSPPPAPAPAPPPAAGGIVPPTPPGRGRPIAPKPAAVGTETEVDVELAEPPPPKPAAQNEWDFDDAPPLATKPGTKRHQKLAEPSRPSRAPLFVGAGVLLLLVGGAVAGVLLSGNKPEPDETVQTPEERKEPNDPPRVAPAPKPKDKESEPIPLVFPPANEGLALKRVWLVSLGNSDVVSVPVLSRDGRAGAFVLNAGNELAFFDPAGGKRLSAPPDHFDKSGLIQPLAGGLFASGAHRGPNVQVWDPVGGKVARSLDSADLPSPGVTFVSPTGRYIAGSTYSEAGGGTFRVKDTQTGKVVFRKPPLPNVSVHFTDDESRVLVAEQTGKCRWFKLPSGEPDGEWAIAKGQNPGPPDAGIKAASGDGSVLAYWGPIGNRPQAVHLLDGATGRVRLSTPAIPGPTPAPTLSHDGRRLMVHFQSPGLPDAVWVIDTATGAVVLRHTATADAPVFRLALSPDGQGCVALAGNGPRRWLIRYEFVKFGTAPPDPPVSPPPDDPLALKPRWTAPGGASPYLVVLFAGSAVFASKPGDGGQAVFDATTGAKRPEFEALDGARTSLVFALPDGRVGTWTAGANEIRCWDAASGKELAALVVPRTPGPAGGGTPVMIVSRNGRYAASGWNPAGPKADPQQSLRVFDLDTGKTAVDIKWSGGRVHFAANPDRVLIAESSGKCRWFKLPSGAPDGDFDLGKPEFSRHEITGASADGSVLAYLGPLNGRTALLAATLDGTSGEVIHRFTGTNNNLCRPALSLDGKRLAAHRSDPATQLVTIDVADARTGAVAARIPTEARRVTFGFSDDGKALAVAAAEPKAAVAVAVYDLPGVAATKPPDPTSPPDPDVPELKTKWSVECKAKLIDATPYFDDDGQRIALVGGGAVAAAAFEAKSGNHLRDLTADPSLKGHFHRLFPLDGGAFAFQNDVDNKLLVWDPGLGKLTFKTFPQPAAPGGVPFVSVAPTERYIAVGHARGGAKESALKVTSSGLAVLTTDWHPGAVAFTKDLSRVLVVDDTDRFRWFKLLPKADPKPEFEWTFGRPANGRNAQLMGVSGDGGLILHYGQPPQKELAVHVLNGKTGEVLHSFPAKRYMSRGGAVSADGKLVALVRDDGSGAPKAVDVRDARSGALVAAVRIAGGSSRPDAAVAVNWKARLVAVYDRDAKKLTAYELPPPPP